MDNDSVTPRKLCVFACICVCCEREKETTIDVAMKLKQNWFNTISYIHTYRTLIDFVFVLCSFFSLCSWTDIYWQSNYTMALKILLLVWCICSIFFFVPFMSFSFASANEARWATAHNSFNKKLFICTFEFRYFVVVVVVFYSFSLFSANFIFKIRTFPSILCAPLLLSGPKCTARHERTTTTTTTTTQKKNQPLSQSKRMRLLFLFYYLIWFKKFVFCFCYLFFVVQNVNILVFCTFANSKLFAYFLFCAANHVDDIFAQIFNFCFISFAL